MAEVPMLPVEAKLHRGRSLGFVGKRRQVKWDKNDTCDDFTAYLSDLSFEAKAL